MKVLYTLKDILFTKIVLEELNGSMALKNYNMNPVAAVSLFAIMTLCYILSRNKCIGQGQNNNNLDLSEVLAGIIV